MSTISATAWSSSATDRISAFDYVLPTGIPDKGKMLTGMSRFWFRFLEVPNHLIRMDVQNHGQAFAAQKDELQSRTMLVRKTQVVPVECCARLHRGLGWKEYKQSQLSAA